MRQVEHCEIHMDTLPCSACQREEQLRTALTEAKEALEKLAKGHCEFSSIEIAEQTLAKIREVIG